MPTPNYMDQVIHLLEAEGAVVVRRIEATLPPEQLAAFVVECEQRGFTPEQCAGMVVRAHGMAES